MGDFAAFRTVSACGDLTAFAAAFTAFAKLEASQNMPLAGIDRVETCLSFDESRQPPAQVFR